MSDEEQKDIQSEFSRLINIFISRIESSKFSFVTILDTVKMNKEKTDNEFFDFVQPFYNQEQTENELKVTLQLPHYKIADFQKINKEMMYHRLSSPTIKRNFIITLVSEFDIFLGQFIKIIFYNKPELLNSLDKQISFKQLLEFQNIENAKEYILEKEIESVLRESHTEHFKWLESRVIASYLLQKIQTKREKYNVKKK
jgi:hypothetical protein